MANQDSNKLSLALQDLTTPRVDTHDHTDNQTHQTMNFLNSQTQNQSHSHRLHSSFSIHNYKHTQYLPSMHLLHRYSHLPMTQIWENRQVHFSCEPVEDCLHAIQLFTTQIPISDEALLAGADSDVDLACGTQFFKQSHQCLTSQTLLSLLQTWWSLLQMSGMCCLLLFAPPHIPPQQKPHSHFLCSRPIFPTHPRTFHIQHTTIGSCIPDFVDLAGRNTGIEGVLIAMASFNGLGQFSK